MDRRTSCDPHFGHDRFPRPIFLLPSAIRDILLKINGSSTVFSPQSGAINNKESTIEERIKSWTPAHRKRRFWNSHRLFSAGGLCLATALHGPQGVQALLEKYREIRTLEAQNATAVMENQRRKERIERLRSNTSEQEMEIRKQLKLLRPARNNVHVSFPTPQKLPRPRPANQLTP